KSESEMLLPSATFAVKPGAISPTFSASSGIVATTIFDSCEAKRATAFFELAIWDRRAPLGRARTPCAPWEFGRFQAHFVFHFIFHFVENRTGRIGSADV